MTANREKPEQLTFFFFEEMPKPTKGTRADASVN